MTVTDIGELADRVEESVRETLRMPALDAARAAANEAGLGRSRANLEAAAKRYEDTLPPYRDAQAAERRTKEQLDAALAEAEWTLNARLVKKSNKTYLPGEDGEERQLSADEVKAWKATEANRLEDVQQARAAHHEAVRAREDRADDVALAERYFTAARLEVEASIAQLQALTTALGRTA